MDDSNRGSPTLSREDILEAIRRVRNSLSNPRVGIVGGYQSAYNKFIRKEIDASLYILESYSSVDKILDKIENLLFRISLRDTKWLSDVEAQLKKLQEDIRFSIDYTSPQLGTVVIK